MTTHTAHTHTHTHRHTHSLAHIHTHIHTHSLTHTHSHTLTHTLSRTLTHSLTHTHTHFTCTHTHSFTRKETVPTPPTDHTHSRYSVAVIWSTRDTDSVDHRPAPRGNMTQDYQTPDKPTATQIIKSDTSPSLCLCMKAVGPSLCC